MYRGSNEQENILARKEPVDSRQVSQQPKGESQGSSENAYKKSEGRRRRRQRTEDGEKLKMPAITLVKWVGMRVQIFEAFEKVVEAHSMEG
jgi:hypothetical protein